MPPVFTKLSLIQFPPPTWFPVLTLLVMFSTQRGVTSSFAAQYHCYNCRWMISVIRRFPSDGNQQEQTSRGFANWFKWISVQSVPFGLLYARGNFVRKKHQVDIYDSVTTCRVMFSLDLSTSVFPQTMQYILVVSCHHTSFSSSMKLLIDVQMKSPAEKAIWGGVDLMDLSFVSEVWLHFRASEMTRTRDLRAINWTLGQRRRQWDTERSNSEMNKWFRK